jgi:hypothetical protein
LHAAAIAPNLAGLRDSGARRLSNRLGEEMSQRNLIIIAAAVVVLILLFMFMGGDSPEPVVATDPPAATEPAAEPEAEAEPAPGN